MDRGNLKGRRIALGVGGGIAAYKCCDLVRELGRAGAAVRVAMTPAAQKFVGPLTFQALSGQPVLTDYFDTSQEAIFGHLDLARWAEAFVIAPATADLVARLRAGMANDVVATSVLAFRGPVLLAPAMNVAMYENRLTQENLKALLAEPRFHVVGPGVGLMADGETGAGRLAEIGEIVDAAAGLFTGGELAGRKVLITAGPTREAIDPVRFVSNPSTGKMGLALAEVARARGAQVTVVLGPVSALDPKVREGLEIIDVITAEEMAKEVLARVEKADFFVACAAVSDYRPRVVAPQKLKKSDAAESLTLVRTPDVLAEASKKVAGQPGRPVLVGFAAETEKVIEYAKAKLESKDLDLIVANDLTVAGAGFAVDTNQVTLLWRSGEHRQVSGSKRDVAAAIWDALAKLRPQG
jgi:phosphopantothenoylcysteine decarboxylase/phosphopantothenate--cysteine ligase